MEQQQQLLLILQLLPGSNTGWQQADLRLRFKLLLLPQRVKVPMFVLRMIVNDQFVISDTLGRSLEIRNMTGPAFATPGKYLVEEAVMGQANKANPVAIDSL